MRRAAFWICAILLAGLPLHAFLFTWIQSQFQGQSWLFFFQSWKEILVLGLAGLALFQIWKTKWRPSKAGWLALAFGLFALLHALIWHPDSLQTLFGLRTDTLFLLAFLGVQPFHFSKKEKFTFLKILLWAGFGTALFGVSQIFLPADFLTLFGFSENLSSWLPGGVLPAAHLTGPDGLVRAQATFSSPNHFGTFLLFSIPATFVFAQNSKNFFWKISLGFQLSALGLTFSRSAWLGFLTSLFASVARFWKKFWKKTLILAFALLASFFVASAFWPFLKEVLIRVGSSSEHFRLSLEGAALAAKTPLGLGLGQAGSVSKLFDPSHSGLVPENWFLGIFLELGWAGGLLFLAWTFQTLKELWISLQKNEALEVAAAFGFLGLVISGLFLHSFESQSSALVAGLLTGLALSSKMKS